MRPFSYSARPTTPSARCAAASEPGRDVRRRRHHARRSACASTCMRPALLVDITGLPLGGIEETPAGGVRIGALARNTDVADHPLIARALPGARRRRSSPARRRSCATWRRSAATCCSARAARTSATSRSPCNKRAPGAAARRSTATRARTRCSARATRCIATHPSDMCVALVALDAVVHTRRVAGERAIAMADLHIAARRPPRGRARARARRADHARRAAADASSRARSRYVRCATARRSRSRSRRRRSRSSSTAGRSREARVALGGVATKPWRAREAEDALVGRRAEQVAVRARRAGGARARGAARRQRVQGRARAADDRARAAARDGSPRMSAVGKPVERVDGRLKVTGAAVYAADTAVANVAHAVIVGSHVARGSATVDDRAAQRLPGVLDVVTAGNAPRLAAAGGQGPGDRVLQLLQDRHVSATRTSRSRSSSPTRSSTRRPAAPPSPRATRPSAALAQLTQALGAAYAPKRPSRRPARPTASAATSTRRCAARRTKSSATYTTPVQNAQPDGAARDDRGVAGRRPAHRLRLDARTSSASRRTLAKAFGLAPDHVRVIDRFVGGAFGCKGSTWSHVALAAIAAKVAGRPVKLVLTRQQMFALVGHRPMTVQTLELGADSGGALTAMRHDVISETSRIDEFVEPSAVATRMLYAVRERRDVAPARAARRPDADVHARARRGVGRVRARVGDGRARVRVRPRSDRAAAAQLRRARRRRPTSRGRASRSASATSAAPTRFGWTARSPAVRATRRDGLLVGLGMATATYPARMHAGDREGARHRRHARSVQVGDRRTSAPARTRS